jgi:hypothetical protein
MAGSLAALSGLGSGRLDRVGRQIEKIGEERSSTHKQTGWGRGEAGKSSVAGLKNKCVNASRRKGIGSLSGTAPLSRSGPLRKVRPLSRAGPPYREEPPGPDKPAKSRPACRFLQRIVSRSSCQWSATRLRPSHCPIGGQPSVPDSTGQAGPLVCGPPGRPHSPGHGWVRRSLPGGLPSWPVQA